MSFREYHIEQAEKLIESAREEGRILFDAALDAIHARRSPPHGTEVALARAQFALNAAQAHAAVAAVTGPEPFKPTGGYA